MRDVGKVMHADDDDDDDDDKGHECSGSGHAQWPVLVRQLPAMAAALPRWSPA